MLHQIRFSNVPKAISVGMCQTNEQSECTYQKLPDLARFAQMRSVFIFLPNVLSVQYNFYAKKPI